MSTHTPGPWQVTRDNKYDQQRISSGDLPVAVTKTEANARLIAAAPDLLAALKHAVNAEDFVDNPWLKQARAAIAKAEGTS